MSDISATRQHPKFDFELTDGKKKIGLMLVNNAGENDPTAIVRASFPRQSQKISSTSNKYSDLEPPYYEIMQDDWSAGRGSLILEDDTKRYMDGNRVWAEIIHQLNLGGQEKYCVTPYTSNLNVYDTGCMSWYQLKTNHYIAGKFTALSNYTMMGVMVWLKYTGTPINLIAEVWTDVAGSPGALIANAFSQPLQYSTIENTISQLRYIELTKPPDLIASTDYWVVIRAASSADTTWFIGVDPAAGNTKVSVNGSSWTVFNNCLKFKTINSLEPRLKFFEYKRALYAVPTRMGGTITNIPIYMNGDRGACDSNHLALQCTNDSSASWAIDQWEGCIILITKGPGSGEKQPWRRIFGNGTNNIVVTPNWEQEQTTESEYVILGSDRWQLQHYLTASSPVLDVAVADEIIYLALDNENIHRCTEKNDNGSWHTFNAVEGNARADKLLAINTPEGFVLWGGLNNDPKYKTCVWKANVPKSWSDTCDLYNLITEIDPIKTVWDEQSINNVAVSVDNDDLKININASFSTGITCTQKLAATDFTKGKKVGIFINSDVACDSGDLQFIYDDTAMCLHHYLPNNLWIYDNEVLPSRLVHLKSHGRPTNIYWYDATGGGSAEGDPLRWYSLYNGRNQIGTSFKVTIETADYLYISSDQPLDQLYIDIITANTNDSSMSAEVWDGTIWLAATITDNTKSGAKTLAVSNTVVITAPSTWTIGCGYLQSSFLAKDEYHIRLKFSATTSATEIREIYSYGDGFSEFPESERFIDMFTPRNDSEDTGKYSVVFMNHASIYIACPNKFNRIHVKVSGANDKDATFTALYFNGDSYVAVSGFSDGTISSGHTLAVNGDITFTMPSNWQKGCQAYEVSYLSRDYYVIKLNLTVTEATSGQYYLNLNTGIQAITLDDDTLIDTFRTIDLARAKDGDPNTYNLFTLGSDDYIYVMFHEKFNRVLWYLDTSIINTIAATMGADYFDGAIWKSLTITDNTASSGKTLGKNDGAEHDMQFSIPYDWMPVSIDNNEGYAIRLHPSVKLSQVKVIGVEIGNENAITTNISALKANTWHWIECPITPDKLETDESKIVSIGIKRAVNKGAQVIRIHGGIKLCGDTPEFKKLGNAEENINGMEQYGDVHQNPWIFTDSNVWEIQTETDDAPVAIPLREIKSLRSDSNGLAHTVSNVYLIFNLGMHLERYYQHNMDDVGVDREQGLPNLRKGNPIVAMSYPGKIFLAIDAGKYLYSGDSHHYSSIMVSKEGGWHEFYRAPNDQRINDIHVQTIPYLTDRMWVSQGSDILWLPIPDTFNPIKDINYRYIHESHLITCWITNGFVDLAKIFSAIKLFTNNLSAGNQYICVDYQLDNQPDSEWVEISDVFVTSPSQEILISKNIDVTGKSIRFRFRLYTNDNTKTPIINAFVLESIMKYPVKHSYTIKFRLEDYPEDYETKDYSLTVEDISDILDEWSDTAKVLQMNCAYTPFDNKLVTIEPNSMKPLEMDADGSSYEKHLCQMTILEA